ncbi:hypothetical protein C8R43DRAFT_963802 [Mycena crocata]|nr:hypothetical protein C8R43DRAFT_963802 [Mycena crocata]
MSLVVQVTMFRSFSSHPTSGLFKWALLLALGLLVTSPSTKPVPLSSTSDAGLPPGVRRSERVNTLYFHDDHQDMTSGASFSFVAATSSITTTISVVAAPAFMPHRFNPVPLSFPLIWLSLGRAALHPASRLLTSSTDCKLQTLYGRNPVLLHQGPNTHNSTRRVYWDIKGDIYAVERTIWVLDPMTGGYVPVKQWKIGFSMYPANSGTTATIVWEWRCSDIRHMERLSHLSLRQRGAVADRTECTCFICHQEFYDLGDLSMEDG